MGASSVSVPASEVLTEAVSIVAVVSDADAVENQTDKNTIEVIEADTAIETTDKVAKTLDDEK